MVTFGLVTEGITDQIIIEHILTGFYDSDDVFISELQPRRDEQNEDKATTHGSWDKVFKYCKSEDFRAALMSTRDLFVIIHIDADVFYTDNIPPAYRIETKELDGSDISYESLLSKIKNKIIAAIGKQFYHDYKERIIFAIAVNSMECWLLPIYFNDNKKRKMVQCLHTLNQALKKEGYTIHAKEPKYYRRASKPYLKNKFFMQKYRENPSLETFINSLKSANINFETE